MMFFTLSEGEISIEATLILSSAYAFDLHHSKILLFRVKFGSVQNVVVW